MTQEAGNLSRHVRNNLRAWRLEKGWSAARLAAEVAELGVPMPRNVIVNLERHRRQEVTLAELAALALVLDVPPVDFVLPQDPTDVVEVAPMRHDRAAWVREWWSGRHALREDIRVDDDAFYRKAPPEIRRHVRAARHGVVQDLGALLVLVEEAVAGSGNAVEHPREHREAIQRYLDRVQSQVQLLLERMESDRG